MVTFFIHTDLTDLSMGRKKPLPGNLVACTRAILTAHQHFLNKLT